MRKYTLYAVGEILLVMTGILLALQVNNWNEDKKDREEERKLLVGLAENLESNINRFEFREELFNSAYQSRNIVINHLQNRLTYHDSLDNHFSGSNINVLMGFFIPSAGYKALSNAGFSIVLSDRLRNEIVDLFENVYAQNMVLYDDFDSNVRAKIDPNEERRFHFGYPLKPLNYTTLLDDEEYLREIKEKLLPEQYFLKPFLDSSMVKSQHVLKLINAELEKSKRK